jgi:hypothetical protein
MREMIVAAKSIVAISKLPARCRRRWRWRQTPAFHNGAWADDAQAKPDTMKTPRSWRDIPTITSPIVTTPRR